MISSYELDGSEIVQVHPIHGRRSLIRADGHGQLVWIGEVAGHLLILDQWSSMGYKDGSLRALDPYTLESKLHLSLDLDAVGIMGLDGSGRFVLCESKAATTTWRAWDVVDWEPLENVMPMESDQIQDLRKVLASVLDLPRAPSIMSKPRP